MTGQESSWANLLFGEEISDKLGDILARVQSVMRKKDEVLDKRLNLLASGRPDRFSGRAFLFGQ